MSSTKHYKRYSNYVITYNFERFCDIFRSFSRILRQERNMRRLKIAKNAGVSRDQNYIHRENICKNSLFIVLDIFAIFIIKVSTNERHSLNNIEGKYT